MTDSTKNTQEASAERDRSGTSTPGPTEVLRRACAQLAELTGRQAESVSSFTRQENGWVLEIEVLEVARVPTTTSLLATYEVTLDEQHELNGYRRVRRYQRGRADPG